MGRILYIHWCYKLFPALTGIDQEGTLHLLHSLLSVPVGLYSMDWGLFSFVRKLLVEGLPLVVEIPEEVLSVQRSIHTVRRYVHPVHVKVAPPSPLEVDVVREGREDPGGHPGPSLLGADLCTPGQRLAPPRLRRQHQLVLPNNFPLSIKFRSALKQDAGLTAICLHGGPYRVPCGSRIYRPRTVLPHGRGASLCAGNPAPLNFLTWGSCP